MKLVLANDDGRLSNHRWASPLFQVGGRLPCEDAAHFLGFADSVGEPFVLFWHASAKPALATLGSLVEQETWPQFLGGVVLYRAAHWAGLLKPLAAQAALRKYGLEHRPVHIFQDLLGNPPSEEAIHLIEAFANALQRSATASPPFWRLIPDPPPYARMAALAVSTLLAEDPDLERGALGQIQWPVLCSDLASDGVECPPEPAPRAFQELERRIRLRHPTTKVPCPVCPQRAASYHAELPQNIFQMDPVLAAPLLRALVVWTRDFVDHPAQISRSAAQPLLDWLSAWGLRDLYEPVMNVIERRFAVQCGMLVERRAEGRLAEIEQELRSPRPDLKSLERPFNALLVCDAPRGIEV